MKSKSAKHYSALVAGALLTACASNSGPPPTPFDHSQSAAAQANSFMATSREKNVKDVNNTLAITSCNVMFAEKSGASASTSPGLFGDVGNNRAEAQVTVLYTLEGLTDADMQRMADQICQRAEQKFTAAGYQVINHEQLRATEPFKALQASGRASPYEYKQGNSRYKVFSRNGDSIFDPRYIGTASGLGQAFKAAAGTAAWQYETRVLDELGATGVNLNLLVDFTELQSDGHSRGLASKNNAKVDSKVEMSVNGEIKLKPHSALNCWERFGKRECEVRDNKTALIYSARPVNLADAFYTEIRNTTTTGDRVSAGITTALALLGAGSSRSTTRYSVDVTAALFENVGYQATDAFVDMALARLAEHTPPKE